MKIAVFCTMWNEEVIMYYYEGMNEWARKTNGVVDIFTCYGKTDLTTPNNVGEFSLYDYPDFDEYDGVILLTSNINSEEVREKLVTKIKAEGKPCVSIDYHIDGFACLYIDQKECLRQVVHHMVEKHGAKNLAYVSGLVSNVEAAIRKEGFLLGMEECNIPVREDLMFEKSFFYNDGIDVAKELLSRGEPLPDTIVCANDDMAAGICEALIDAGIEVGKEVRVTGFDMYYLGENFAPALTTIRRPRASIAYQACQMLESYDPSEVREVSAELFLGETCGCHLGEQVYTGDFRRHVFHSTNEGDNFNNMLSAIEEDLIKGVDVKAIIHHFDEFFARKTGGHFRILINPAIESYSEELRDTNVFHSYCACNQEYLVWNRVTPDGENRIAGHAYVYAPIHFQDHMYAVLIFGDMNELLSNRELYNFTKSFGFALENVIQKRRYAYVNDKLESLFETDYLTQCYNRHGYAKYASQMHKQAKEEGKIFHTIFADVDGLKKINDDYGHEAGDTVIREVAEALRAVIMGKETKVFRYGGDEFLVLAVGEYDFEAFRERFDARILQRNEEINPPYKLSASLGHFAVQPSDTRSLEECIKAADVSMYDIKQKHHAVAKES